MTLAARRADRLRQPDHLRPEVREQAARRFANVERLEADDAADAITYVVTRSRRVSVHDILVRSTEQEA